jgi:hypothetical protein
METTLHSKPLCIYIATRCKLLYTERSRAEGKVSASHCLPLPSLALPVFPLCLTNFNALVAQTSNTFFNAMSGKRSSGADHDEPAQKKMKTKLKDEHPFTYVFITTQCAKLLTF